jgi:hypothetical protein
MATARNMSVCWSDNDIAVYHVKFEWRRGSNVALLASFRHAREFRGCVWTQWQFICTSSLT